MNVRILVGDIAKTESDVLIVPIGVKGKGNSSLDQLIRRVAGSGFYDALLNLHYSTGGLRNGDLHMMVDPSGSLPFDGLLFVVDDHKEPLPLWSLVEASLDLVAKEGCLFVTMPVWRQVNSHFFKRDEMEREQMMTLRAHSFPGTVMVVTQDLSQARRLLRYLEDT